MNLKRMVCASALAGGIGAASLFGLGVGTASAEPGGCAPNTPNCQQGPGGPGGGPGGPGGGQRGIDQGRQDHQPFFYNGQQVQPLPAGNGHGWGFWFLGQWIPL
jgi:hypothetical protein